VAPRIRVPAGWYAPCRSTGGTLFDNALTAAGLLEDARDTVSRMNALMEKALG